MRVTTPSRYFNVLILILTLVLASCGGGSDSAGGGGSGGNGSGGSGVATVTGNVSWVVEAEPQVRDRTLGQILIAAITRYLSTPAGAQSFDGIQVIGGGQQAVTDVDGNFSLEGVTPSNNFVLRFELDENQSIALPIGEVPDGSRVTVFNIVLNAELGTAQAEGKEIEENAGGPSAEGGSDRDQNGTADGDQNGASM